MQKITFRKEDLALARQGRKPDFHSNLQVDFTPPHHELPEHTQEIDQLKSIIKNLGTKVQELLEEKNHALQTTTRLEKELLGSAQRENPLLEHLTLENHNLSSKNNALLENEQLLTKEIEELKRALHSQNGTSQETAALKEQLALKDGHIHSYKNELDSFKAHVQTLERKLVESQNNRSQLDQSNTSSYLKALFEKQQIEDELSALKCEKIATSRRLQELSIENASFGKEVELAQDKNRVLIAAVESAENKREELHQERMKLQDALSEERQRSLQTTLDLKEKELLYASEVAKNHECHQRILELEGVKEREIVLQNQYQELITQFQELETEHSTLQDAFRGKIEEASSLHELLSHRTQELDSIRSHLETVVHQQAEQAQAYTELHESYSDQMGQVHNLEIDLTHCREELQETFKELAHFKTLLNRYTQAEHLTLQLYDLFRETNE